MANFVVAYDLNKQGQNYDCITEKLKSLHSFHAQGSVWFVKYDGTAGQLRDHLSPCCDKNDVLFVGKLETWSGYHMPKGADFLNS